MFLSYFSKITTNHWKCGFGDGSWGAISQKFTEQLGRKEPDEGPTSTAPLIDFLEKYLESSWMCLF